MTGRRWLRIGGVSVLVLLVLGGIVAVVGGGGRSGPSNASAPKQASGGGGSALQDRAATGMTADGAAAPATKSEAATGPTGLGGLDSPDPTARVVKNAAVGVTVARGRLTSASDALSATVAGAHGFVTASDTARGSAHFVVRVPETAFSSTLAAIHRQGKVTSETSKGEDVTARFVDIDARLRNWRAQEVVLLDLMRQAKNIPDSIAVQQQLSQIQQQIEELEGQRRMLDDQASFSTIDVTFSVVGAASPGEPAGRSTLAAAWDDAAGVALAVVGGSLVVLGALVPLALILALVGGLFLGGRALVRRGDRVGTLPS
jgi:hypothetical protein